VWSRIKYSCILVIAVTIEDLSANLAPLFFVCPPEGGLGSSWLKHALKQRSPTTRSFIFPLLAYIGYKRKPSPHGTRSAFPFYWTSGFFVVLCGAVRSTVLCGFLRCFVIESVRLSLHPAARLSFIFTSPLPNLQIAL
jgi:hypothetical protein